MVAYHYWKCYHKESSAFQTASLYSIEVDYYHFGTCEIVEGSYFCGDHSCSTYKYIGGKDVVENLENKYLPNQRYVQPGLESQDNTEAQYQKLAGRWFKPTQVSNVTLMQWLAQAARGVANPLTSTFPFHLKPYALDAVFQTPLHLQRNLYAGLCEKRCSADPTCKAYQESRFGISGVNPECYLFHMPNFISTYSGVGEGITWDHTAWWQKEGDAESDQSHLSDFYLKITNPKTKAWVHTPKQIGVSMPHPPGSEDLSATVRDPVPPVRRRLANLPVGRRLSGVY